MERLLTRRNCVRTMFMQHFAGSCVPSGRTCSKGPVWLLMAAAALLLFTGLGVQPLLDPTEGRQAEIARTMLANGHWLVPHSMGEPYYEKPPLHYWLCMLSYAVLGATSGTARLVPAVAAWITVFITYLWGRQALGERAGVAGGLVLLLSAGFLIVGRTVAPDSLLTACVVASWYLAYAAIHRDNFSWLMWLLSALACGLGLLTKGPVALLLVLPPVLTFQLLDSRMVRPKVWPWALFLFISLGIALPWFAYMAFAAPGWIDQFLWKGNLARFAQPTKHQQPWWFYLPLLYAFTIPWCWLWPALAVYLCSRRASVVELRPAGLGFSVLAFLWCFLFFSASGSKLPAYMVPALAPLALMVAACVDGVLFRQGGRLHGLLGLLRYTFPRWATLGVLLVCLGCFLTAVSLGWRSWNAVGMRIFIAVGLSLIWWHLGWKLRRVGSWAGCTAAVAFLLAFGVNDLRRGYASRHSPAFLARSGAAALSDPVKCVVSYGRQWPSASFYLKRDVVMFVERTQSAKLQEFMRQRCEVYVLVETGPLLAEVLALLPEGSEAKVHGPPLGKGIAIVVIRLRLPSLASR